MCVRKSTLALVATLLAAASAYAVDYSFDIYDHDGNGGWNGQVVVWQRLETAVTWESLTTIQWHPPQLPFTGASNYYYAFRAIIDDNPPYSPFVYPDPVSGTVELHCTLTTPPDNPCD